MTHLRTSRTARSRTARAPRTAHAPYHLHLRHHQHVAHHRRGARMRDDVTSTRIGPGLCHIVPVGSDRRGVEAVD